MIEAAVVGDGEVGTENDADPAPDLADIARSHIRPGVIQQAECAAVDCECGSRGEKEKYRPEQWESARDAFTKAIGNVRQQRGVMVRVLSKHLKRWDLTRPDGSEAPIEEDEFRRKEGVIPLVTEAIFLYIFNYQCDNQEADGKTVNEYEVPLSPAPSASA